jgi:hypothetical protein
MPADPITSNTNINKTFCVFLLKYTNIFGLSYSFVIVIYIT